MNNCFLLQSYKGNASEKQYRRSQFSKNVQQDVSYHAESPYKLKSSGTARCGAVPDDFCRKLHTSIRYFEKKLYICSVIL